jgi:hypothetical protein
LRLRGANRGHAAVASGDPILVTSSDERSLATLPIPDVGARVVQLPERRILWRDNYSNLLGTLK